jgi:hypothetical protein
VSMCTNLMLTNVLQSFTFYVLNQNEAVIDIDFSGNLLVKMVVRLLQASTID